MMDFHFLRPLWLLGLAAAAGLAWSSTRREDFRRKWGGIIAQPLLDHLVIAPGTRARIRPVHSIVLVMVLASVSAAGPTWQREQPPFVEDRAPLVIAIDLSQTMDAIDVTPTRLERAKLKVRDLLALRRGGRTAVVAYSGSAHLVLPLTDDAALLQTYTDALETSVMPVAGRNTVRAIEAAESALAREDTPGTLLLLTGGVEDEAMGRLKTLMDGGHLEPMVLGIGTAEGGPVRTGPQTYLTGASGERVFARLDIDALNRLQRQTGVPVATVTGGRDDVEWIQRRVQSHLQARQTETNTRWKDEGWWLAIPLAVVGVFWFRRGWTMRWSSAAALLLMLATPAPASAQGWSWDDLWWTRDQQGQAALERGDYAAAAERFVDPMWKGVSLYRAGAFAEALDQFARVNTPESDYNQGNALAQIGRFPEAVARYEAALKPRPDFPEARANLALVRKLIPPPKKDDEQQAQDPNQKPDDVKFDEKGKKGKRGQMNIGTVQTADVWMRNIQTTPTGLLRRRFAIEAKQP